MIKAKIICSYLLIITTSLSQCNGLCHGEFKHHISIMFCEKSVHCANTTANEYLDHFRSCLAGKNDVAKKLIESGNKLNPDQCLKVVGKGVCAVVKDMNDNGLKYMDCIANFEAMTTLLEHCLPVGSELTIAIEKLDKIICADQAQLKCKSPDAQKALNLVKDCMTGNNSEFKTLIEKKLNKNQCKTEAKNIFMKAIKDNKFNVIDCIEMNKDQIDQANPFEKCTGLN